MEHSLIPILLQEYAVPDGRFDVALFWGVTHDLDPLVLFNRAFDVLNDKGRLILFGEFEQSRDAPGTERRPLVDHWIAQAERCGLSLTKRFAVSDPAAPTMASLRQMLSEQHTAILTQEDLGETHAADLADQTLAELQQGYREPGADRLVLEFERGDPPLWRLTTMQPRDAAAIRELFATVFDQEMSPALWEWKYAPGRGHAILAWREGQLVAHYGALTRDMVFRGELLTAVVPCDVMVRPSDRGGRRGPFFLTAATFLEHYVSKQGPYRLAYGFPNSRALKAGQIMGFYGDTVATMTEITWSPKLLAFSPGVTAQRIGPDSGQDELTRVWEGMKADLADQIVGVRDGQFILRRYLDHPENQYDVYLVQKRRGDPLGLIVLKQEARHCVLMDIVGPMQSIPVLVTQARHATSRLGKRRLRMWISEPQAQLFQGTGGEFKPMDIAIPTNAWTSGPSVESLRDAWWLTAGDTDFL